MVRFLTWFFAFSMFFAVALPFVKMDCGGRTCEKQETKTCSATIKQCCSFPFAIDFDCGSGTSDEDDKGSASSPCCVFYGLCCCVFLVPEYRFQLRLPEIPGKEKPVFEYGFSLQSVSFSIWHPPAFLV